MSFFAYLAIHQPTPAEQQSVIDLLAARGLAPRVVALASEYGAESIYGLDVVPAELFEIELDGNAVDLQEALLEFEDEDGRLEHYRRCGAALAIEVSAFHDVEEVDRRFEDSPLELPVVSLVRELTAIVQARPIVFNLDPEMSARFGEARDLDGVDQIREGVWRAVCYHDLEDPLRLIVAAV